MELQKILENKATEADFHMMLAAVRWVDNAICPYCKSNENYKRSGSHSYKCRNCNCSFTVTTGTLFHATKLPLRKWFTAIHLITQASKGISSLQLARTIGVNKNTAWYMQYRIREGMKSGELFRLLCGRQRDLEIAHGNRRRHRNRIRPAKSCLHREKRHVASPPSAINKLLLNRAIKGQYHQLSDFHIVSYDYQILFIRRYYKPFLVSSLLTAMCATM